MTIEYSKDGLIYKAFQRLKNLPFVPVKDIPQAFSEVSSLSPNSFTPMLDYIEEYYIGKLKINSRTQRKELKLPIKYWNGC